MNVMALRPTWFAGLGAILSADINRENVEHIFDDVTIVCFNYDRCIEQYLAYFLNTYYHLPLNEARELVQQKLNILRPYGQVAPPSVDL